MGNICLTNIPGSDVFQNVKSCSCLNFCTLSAITFASHWQWKRMHYKVVFMHLNMIFFNIWFLQNTDWVHQKCIFPTCWKFNKTRHVWWIWFRNWNSSYYAILRIMIIFSLTSHFKSEVLFWVYVCRLSWCDPSLWGNLLIRAGKSKSLTCWKRLKGWKGQNSSDSTVSTDSSISPVSHDSPIS